jgi:subtilisin family serine protease
LVRGAGLTGEELAARLALEDARPYFSMAVPDYHFELEPRAIDVPPDDPRYGGQWFLEKLGIEETWAYSTGNSTVTVVVIDNGCDAEHPDLIAKLDPGLDVIDDDDDPSPRPNDTGNAHGTSCAGLIGASTDNGIGVAGVCPECRVRCVRMLDGMVSLNGEIRAFEFAKNTGAGVVSNSWGFVGGIAVPGPLAAAVLDVIDNGRNGRGAVVVFAAGNENREINDDEIEALRDVIAVGALTIFDEATSFSNHGRAVDVTSPVGTLTTDISGADGSDPGDYTNSFGGTSSACPLVAGVAGLLLSAKPDVSARDVERAIIETTRAAPFAQPGPDGHDPLYGYGIVSAPKAMRRLLGLPEPDPDAGIADTGEPPDSGEAPDAGVEADAGTPVETPDAEDPGCDCASARGSGGLSWLVLGLLMLGLLRRARVRR